MRARARRRSWRWAASVARTRTRRYHLAFFGQFPWNACPAIPPEMMFLPGRRRSASTTCPAGRARSSSRCRSSGPKSRCAALPAGVRRRASCFDGARRAAGPAPAPRGWGTLFRGVDRAAQGGASAFRAPRGCGARAVERAAAWMIERLADSDGLSAILPAMANSVLALKCLGHGEDHPLLREALGHLDGLLLRDDAGGAAHAALPLARLGHASSRRTRSRKRPARPSTRRCARAAVVAARQADPPSGRLGACATRRRPAAGTSSTATSSIPTSTTPAWRSWCCAQARAEVARGARRRRRSPAASPGCSACRTDDGGWASFDRGNDKEWLTARPLRRSQRDDRSQHRRHHRPRARVPEPLPRVRRRPPGRRAARCEFLRARPDAPTAPGTAAGASTTSTAPGRCCAACARIGEDMDAPHVRRAARWLHRTTRTPTAAGARASPATTTQPQRASGPSTPSQTAWAIMGLVAAGQARQRRRPPRHSPPARAAGRRRDLGARRRGPARASRRSSISTTTTTGTLPADGARAIPAGPLRRRCGAPSSS